ncbi:MAG: DUF1592 domain-containing protein [Planctomycetaceae bacterium]|nr:DUF1592 domain-containing protein [Planctomycetaceae bacterium]
MPATCSQSVCRPWHTSRRRGPLLSPLAGRLIVLLCVTAVTNTSRAHFSSRPQSEDNVASLVQSNCLLCHGEDATEGDIDLRSLTDSTSAPDADLIRRVIRVLDLREMPPEDEEQPSPDARTAAVSQLTSRLEILVGQEAVQTAPIRRMNRFQYHNAVQDLFDLKCIVYTLPERMMREHGGYFQPASGVMPEKVMVGSRPLGKSQMIEPRLAGVAAFPQDLRAEHGFDNQGDHLSLSPLLMEAFLKLGQSITQSKDFGPRNVGIWKTFFDAPAKNEDVSQQVRQRLLPFLRRAFRRPIREATAERYVSFVVKQLEQGTPFPEAMKTVAAAVISSPRFLYLYSPERSGAEDSQPDNFELAGRLSFFLWGSIPDDRLLDLAADGRLAQSDVLDDEFRRMLQDRKLKRFCDSFPAQWLQLERIISSVPNRSKFPQFYFSKYRDSMHMMMEPLLLFETVLIENRSVTQLVDPDFSYRSVLLDEAYGDLKVDLRAQKKKGGGSVTQLPFYRIPIKDRRTGGVITNTAVMTMTSGPERTQPITRGAWIATVIFNNPPDPPPADVPPLGEKPADGEEHFTLRERLAAHRERSDCRGCHEQIDPLGFALENFDPVGAWRDRYENDRDIDMAGTLFRQHTFSDVVQFKDAIMQEKHRFAEALGGHLLRFALGRQLTAADELAVGRIAEQAKNEDYRLHSLLRAVVRSRPFLAGELVAAPTVARSATDISPSDTAGNPQSSP